MSELVGILAVAIIGVLAATVTARVTVRSQVARTQKDNALLYLWNRQLVDHIYKGNPPPPPGPPEGLFE